MVSCTALKMFAAALAYLCCYQLVRISALCSDGVTTSGACVQTCKGAGGCTCNTSQPLNTSYDSCSQTCTAPSCFGTGKMICESNKNCNQTCNTGSCDMSCEAVERCVQHGDDNGLKKMSCESKQCTQSCKAGNCKTMHCEGDNCYQSCDKGGCTMNCTQSVKSCVQRCTAIADCIMDCHAEECHQQCSGPKKCMILNSGFSRISVNYLAYFIVFATVKFFF